MRAPIRSWERVVAGGAGRLAATAIWHRPGGARRPGHARRMPVAPLAQPGGDRSLPATPVARGEIEMAEQTYDDDRARNLEQLLRTLADRIRELHEQGVLLRHAGELTQLIGNVRSELFHYEVRATYDTPEVADGRRIVAEARAGEEESTWSTTDWTPDDEDDEKW